MRELEYGLIVTASAFNRWMLRCMAAAGRTGLSSTDIAFLHLIAHRGREKRLIDIALDLDIEDIRVVSYEMKKLEAAGLIRTGRQFKGKLVQLSESGVKIYQRYARV